jgi:hypothetical protein
LNLDRLPPSAKLVIKVLESGSLLTQKGALSRNLVKYGFSIAKSGPISDFIIRVDELGSGFQAE